MGTPPILPKVAGGLTVAGVGLGGGVDGVGAGVALGLLYPLLAI